MRPWYCAQTIPNGEDQARREIERQGFPTFLPTYLVKLADRHISVRKLFRNYIFVSLDDPALWPLIHRTHGVARFLTYAPARGKVSEPEYLAPLLIESRKIESLREQALAYDEIQRGGKPRAASIRQMITAGCYVRVLNGPLADHPCAQRALVDWAEHDRAALLIEMFNRKVRMEFFRRDLELVA